jgi:hypothetical protein
MFSHYSSFIPLVLVLFVWGTFVTVTNIYIYDYTSLIVSMWRCTYSILGSGGDTAVGRRHDGYLKFEIKSLGLPKKFCLLVLQSSFSKVIFQGNIEIGSHMTGVAKYRFNYGLIKVVTKAGFTSYYLPYTCYMYVDTEYGIQ